MWSSATPSDGTGPPTFDIAALVGFAGLYWLYRNRGRFGSAAGYAKDSVCGMQVQIAHAPAAVAYQGSQAYFCSERCRDRFQADPDRYVARVGAPGGGPDADHAGGDAGAERAGELIDPVCGMAVDRHHAAAHRRVDGSDIWFCSLGRAEAFDAEHSGAASRRHRT